MRTITKFWILSAFVLTLLAVGFAMTRHHGPSSEVVIGLPTRTAETPGTVLVATLNPPPFVRPDDPFFVFNNGSITDFSRGDQFFGSQDKVGVDATIMDSYSGELDDFIFIGTKNAEREQFLNANGTTLDNANRKWHVIIGKAGAVNSDVRVRVVAYVGMDVEENGGKRMGIEKKVHEIWKLDPIGDQPVLLERTLDRHNGVFTHAESPIPDLTWTTGIQMGGSQN